MGVGEVKRIRKKCGLASPILVRGVAAFVPQRAVRMSLDGASANQAV